MYRFLLDALRRRAGGAWPTRAARRGCLTLVCGLLALTLAGCRPDEAIRTYSIPKEAEEAPPAELPAGRMLGAVVVRPTQGWFFKLMGPSEAVAAQADAFQSFLKTVKFPAAGPPTWQVPAGWREEPGGPMREATLVIPSEPKPLELTIVKLPRGGEDEADYVLKNVNRWRGQLQLPPIDKTQLAAETSPLELDGATATTVNIEGKLAPGGGTAMPGGRTAMPGGGTAMPGGGPFAPGMGAHPAVPGIPDGPAPDGGGRDGK